MRTCYHRSAHREREIRLVYLDSLVYPTLGILLVSGAVKKKKKTEKEITPEKDFDSERELVPPFLIHAHFPSRKTEEALQSNHTKVLNVEEEISQMHTKINSLKTQVIRNDEKIQALIQMAISR